jgi:hypothetical protein
MINDRVWLLRDHLYIQVDIIAVCNFEYYYTMLYFILP